jgi:hypothetical protein
MEDKGRNLKYHREAAKKTQNLRQNLNFHHPGTKNFDRDLFDEDLNQKNFFLSALVSWWY